MDFQFVVMQLFNGLILGSIYVILALGLTIIFGMLGIINFAHGAFYMFGAFLAYTIMTYLVPNFWVALIGVPLIMALFGAACEAFILRRLYNLPPLYVMLFTFGLMLTLQDAVRMIFGAAGVPFRTPAFLDGAVNLGFMIYPKYRLFLILVTALVSLGVWLFLSKTKLGAIVRAGTDNSIMVDALGINISKNFYPGFRPGYRTGRVGRGPGRSYPERQSSDGRGFPGGLFCGGGHWRHGQYHGLYRRRSYRGRDHRPGGHGLAPHGPHPDLYFYGRFSSDPSPGTLRPGGFS